MSSVTASLDGSPVLPGDRLEVLFEELSQLCGQRNAIDGRIVDIVAEIDRDELCGITGARSVPAMVAWNCGRVFSRCMKAPPLEPAGANRGAGQDPEGPQTARRLRPLARRALMTARPPRVFMRTRKPWVRARRVLEGW